MTDVPQIVARAPVSSVNHNRHWMRALAVRQIQFSELKFILAVIEMQSGRSCRDIENALRYEASRHA